MHVILGIGYELSETEVIICLLLQAVNIYSITIYHDSNVSSWRFFAFLRRSNSRGWLVVNFIYCFLKINCGIRIVLQKMC